MKKNYKKRYRILIKGVKQIVRELKRDIYDEKIPPTALRYMSDLKYYLLLSYYSENQERKAKEMIEKELK